MGKMLRNGIAVVALAVLSGCASMSGDECMTSDWQTVGYEDGFRGYTGDRIGKYRKACSKHGVTPNLTDYMAGRERGLVEYCQPGRGFSVGSRGGRYNGVCSANQEGDFLDAYNVGYQLYTLRASVSRADSAIASKESELRHVEESIDANEAALISDETTSEERLVLLTELKNLSERVGQLETGIRALYEERARHQVELERYQVFVADLGY